LYTVVMIYQLIVLTAIYFSYCVLSLRSTDFHDCFVLALIVILTILQK